jgi:hypothetical protein
MGDPVPARQVSIALAVVECSDAQCAWGVRVVTISMYETFRCDERATLREVVVKVLSVPLGIELICVDDGSRDGSREILTELQSEHPQIRIVLQPHNMGKGAALRSAFQLPHQHQLSDMETCY